MNPHELASLDQNIAESLSAIQAMVPVAERALEDGADPRELESELYSIFIEGSGLHNPGDECELGFVLAVLIVRMAQDKIFERT